MNVDSVGTQGRHTDNIMVAGETMACLHCCNTYTNMHRTQLVPDLYSNLTKYEVVQTRLVRFKTVVVKCVDDNIMRLIMRGTGDRFMLTEIESDGSVDASGITAPTSWCIRQHITKQ